MGSGAAAPEPKLLNFLCTSHSLSKTDITRIPSAVPLTLAYTNEATTEIPYITSILIAIYIVFSRVRIAAGLVF